MQPGETLGVLGESGSGKSTLAAALLRLLPANGKIESGAVLFEGLDLLQAEPGALQRIRGARIAVIFQEPLLALHPMIRIGDQVKDVLAAHESSSRGLIRQKTLQLIGGVFPTDAARRADSYPAHLSVGHQTRGRSAPAV